MSHVLITGGAGAIGGQVLRAIEQQLGLQRVSIIGGEPIEPTPSGTTMQVVDGDLGQPRFGLSDDGFARLGDSVDTVFHCAERTVLDADLDAARAANVQPVATLVELLEANPRARLAHVSTTMVAGTKRGLFTEFDLACGQQFHNAYEQSKFEAETLLRESSVWDRVTVFRRSLTAGGPESAHTPLNALLRGLAGRRPMLLAGDPRMRLDAVPLSYVARAMVALAGQPAALGQTLHLVAGLVQSRPLGELVTALRDRFHRGRVGFVPPMLSAIARLIGIVGLGLVEVFPGRHGALVPYFRHRQAFDDFVARALLEPLGVRSPAPEVCLAELLDELHAA